MLRRHDQSFSDEFGGYKLDCIQEALTLDRYCVSINRFSPLRIPWHVIMLLPVVQGRDIKRREDTGTKFRDGMRASIAQTLNQLTLDLYPLPITRLNCDNQGIKLRLTDDGWRHAGKAR